MKSMLKIWIILLASLVLVVSTTGCPSRFTVTTDIATLIKSDSATLHGRLDTGVPEDFSAEVYFAWGQDKDSLDTAGEETNPRTQKNIGEFTAPLAGLTPNTTYYYQARTDITDLVGGLTKLHGAIHNFTTTPEELVNGNGDGDGDGDGNGNGDSDNDCILTFSDDTFNNDDWRAHHTESNNTLASFSQVEGSNPYRQMVHRYHSMTGQMIGLVDLYLFLESEYDPSACGAIDHFDFSADVRLDDGIIIARRFIVFQDGKWYWAGYHSEQDSFPGAGTWQTFEV